MMITFSVEGREISFTVQAVDELMFCTMETPSPMMSFSMTEPLSNALFRFTSSTLYVSAAPSPSLSKVSSPGMEMTGTVLAVAAVSVSSYIYSSLLRYIVSLRLPVTLFTSYAKNGERHVTVMFVFCVIGSEKSNSLPSSSQ